MTVSVEQRIHPPTSRTWIGLAVVLLAVLMGQIDMFAVTLAAPGTVEESRTSNPPRLDAVGAVLAGLTLAAVLIPLSLGSEAGWPPWSWASLSAGTVLLAGFLAYQRTVARRGGQPIVPPRLFTSRGFALSMLTVAVFYAGNAGLFLVLTYHLQAGLRLGPLATGLAFTPLGAGFAVASAAGKRLASRFGTRVATAGAVLMAISLLLVPAVTGTNNATQAWALAGVLGMSGLGQGLVVALLLSTVLSLISTDDAGAGSGVLNTVTQASMATGVATVGAFYQAVLGTNPDKPTIPLDTSQFTITFNIVALALAALAIATALLLERLQSTGQRKPSDVRPS